MPSPGRPDGWTGVLGALGLVVILAISVVVTAVSNGVDFGPIRILNTNLVFDTIKHERASTRQRTVSRQLRLFDGGAARFLVPDVIKASYHTLTDSTQRQINLFCFLSMLTIP